MTAAQANTLVGAEHSASGRLLWQERVHLNERRKDWRNRF
jgi:hypothetical protein